MPSSQRSRDFLLPQGQPASKHVLLFSDFVAHRKSLGYCIRWNHNIIVTHCRVSLFRSSSTTQAFFFLLLLFFCRQTTELLFSFILQLGASCKRLQTSFNLSSLFFNVHLLSHWQAQAVSNTTTSPGMPANVHRSTYNLNSYNSRTRAWAAFTQKTVPQRCSTIAFDFLFLHQISCTTVQSISETTSQKTHLAGHQAWSPRLAPQCLAFP